MKKLYVVLGVIALGIGAVGVVLPLIPITFPLLIAAFCFAKSSPRLDRWFKGTKLYKNNLESFARGKGMTVKAKLRIIISVTIVMAIAFIAMQNVPIGRICLAVVWVGHIVGIGFFVKTCPEETVKEKPKEESLVYDDQ